MPITLIEVEVRDNKGNEVVDLRKDDFRVYENGIRQTIDFWHRKADSELADLKARYEMAYFTPDVEFEGEYRYISVVARGKDKKKLNVKYSPAGYFATKELIK